MRVNEKRSAAGRFFKLIGPLAQRLEARMDGNKFKAVLAIKLAHAAQAFDPEERRSIPLSGSKIPIAQLAICRRRD